MRGRSRQLEVIARAAVALAALCVAGGCGGGGRVLEKDEQPKAVGPAEPAPPDAFRDFTGDRLPLAGEFHIINVPKAVEGVEVVVHLLKVDESEWTAPSGKKMRDGTASLRVEKGQESKRVSIDQGAFKDVFGARIHVVEAKIEYDDEKMNEVPQATLKIERAP